MTDYRAVQTELAAGTPPEVICATCPWDRLCIQPPVMSKAQIDAQLAEAKAKDAEQQAKSKAEGKDGGFPMGTLITSLAVSGKDTAGTLCPVFTLRLRSEGGRGISDSIRARMRDWSEEVSDEQVGGAASSSTDESGAEQGNRWRKGHR